MTNCDFLFVGGIFPKDDIKEILNKSKRGLQMAANNFQWSLIEGFDKNLSKPLKIHNVMFVGSFPLKYEDFIITGKQFSHTYGAEDYNLGFINLLILKHFLNPFGEKKRLKKWAVSNNKIKIVFIYSLSSRTVRVARLLKKYNPNIHICVSVNDLPENIMLGKRGNSLLVKLWKNISKRKVNKGLKHIDSFMIVAEGIASSLKLENKPYVVIEALTKVNRKIKFNNENDSLKKVVYSGGLIENYGILNLIRAFVSIKDDQYRLIICGDGDCKEKIIEYSKFDKRIEYLGVLPHNEILQIQQSATVLVNPRQNNGNYTNFSFPIKTIEYLLSGTPVIGYKLDGIPNEYDDYLIYVSDNSIEALSDEIIRVCNLPNDFRKDLGYKNIKFVETEKNNVIQTKKILNMMISESKNRIK